MKIILCACDQVGMETARFLGDIGDIPVCLIVDQKNRNGYNEQIIDVSRVKKQAVISSNELKEKATLKRLQSLQSDLGILAWWPYIIDKTLITIPQSGFINFHPSFLPYNRGKDPNFWALATGTPFGVTIHYVDEGVDSGEIIAQKRIETTWEDTGQSLYYKAKKEMIHLFKECYHTIKTGSGSRTSQNLENGSLHLRKDLDKVSQIELDQSYRARDLLNLMRARTFPPHPAVWFEEDGQRYEVRINITRAERK